MNKIEFRKQIKELACIVLKPRTPHNFVVTPYVYFCFDEYKMNFCLTVLLLFLTYNQYCCGSRISTKDYFSVVIPYYRFRNVQIITHLGCLTKCKNSLYLKKMFIGPEIHKLFFSRSKQPGNCSRII